MSKFLPPRTTTAIRLANTPLKGELLFDTDLDKLFIGDGVTVGGIEVGTGAAGGGGGSGDMLKSIYDTNNDGIVDLAKDISGTPTSNQYYGTNASGIKGFFSLPTGGTGGGVTSYNDLTDKPVLGTASSRDAGTGANEVLLLSQSNKLPALDGSLLTNLPSSGGGGGGASSIGRNRVLSMVVAGLTI